MNVKEFYIECLLYEESSLCHYIHHLLLEHKVSLEDDLTKLDSNLADHQKVAEMIENNILGIHKIRIYSLKMNQQEFVFIFAATQQEAISFYTKTFHQSPLNCHEYLLDFELARGIEVISFRDMRKEYLEFPAVVGYYSKSKYC